MEKVLIDTHTFLWFMDGNNLLSSKARKYIEETPLVYLSIISIWEIAIKQNIGKLDLSFTIEQYVDNWKNTDGKILNINENQVFEYQKLELHHRDPFDRMLIAQAITENMPIISADTKFDLYSEIKRIW
jgi:PIN domain nuclease of toxin-antitoxin system